MKQKPKKKSEEVLSLAGFTVGDITRAMVGVLESPRKKQAPKSKKKKSK